VTSSGGSRFSTGLDLSQFLVEEPEDEQKREIPTQSPVMDDGEDEDSGVLSMEVHESRAGVAFQIISIVFFTIFTILFGTFPFPGVPQIVQGLMIFGIGFLSLALGHYYVHKPGWRVYGLGWLIISMKVFYGGAWNLFFHYHLIPNWLFVVLNIAIIGLNFALTYVYDSDVLSAQAFLVSLIVASVIFIRPVSELTFIFILAGFFVVVSAIAAHRKSASLVALSVISTNLWLSVHVITNNWSIGDFVIRELTTPIYVFTSGVVLGVVSIVLATRYHDQENWFTSGLKRWVPASLWTISLFSSFLSIILILSAFDELGLPAALMGLNGVGYSISYLYLRKSPLAAAGRHPLSAIVATAVVAIAMAVSPSLIWVAIPAGLIFYLALVALSFHPSLPGNEATTRFTDGIRGQARSLGIFGGLLVVTWILIAQFGPGGAEGAYLLLAVASGVMLTGNLLAAYPLLSNTVLGLLYLGAVVVGSIAATGGLVAGGLVAALTILFAIVVRQRRSASLLSLLTAVAIGWFLFFNGRVAAVIGWEPTLAPGEDGLLPLAVIQVITLWLVWDLGEKDHVVSRRARSAREFTSTLRRMGLFSLWNLVLIGQSIGIVAQLRSTESPLLFVNLFVLIAGFTYVVMRDRYPFSRLYIFVLTSATAVLVQVFVPALSLWIYLLVLLSLVPIYTYSTRDAADQTMLLGPLAVILTGTALANWGMDTFTATETGWLLFTGFLVLYIVFFERYAALLFHGVVMLAGFLVMVLVTPPTGWALALAIIDLMTLVVYYLFVMEFRQSRIIWKHLEDPTLSRRKLFVAKTEDREISALELQDLTQLPLVLAGVAIVTAVFVMQLDATQSYHVVWALGVTTSILLLVGSFPGISLFGAGKRYGGFSVPEYAAGILLAIPYLLTYGLSSFEGGNVVHFYWFVALVGFYIALILTSSNLFSRYHGATLLVGIIALLVKFISLASGTVLAGPKTEGLPEINLLFRDAQIVLIGIVYLAIFSLEYRQRTRLGREFTVGRVTTMANLIIITLAAWWFSFLLLPLAGLALAIQRRDTWTVSLGAILFVWALDQVGGFYLGDETALAIIVFITFGMMTAVVGLHYQGATPEITGPLVFGVALMSLWSYPAFGGGLGTAVVLALVATTSLWVGLSGGRRLLRLLGVTYLVVASLVALVAIATSGVAFVAVMVFTLIVAIVVTFISWMYFRYREEVSASV